ncbi:MAG TPA: DUF6584 family protein [Planctomycetota bacterium]|nr:DUF6584 family protein [Planctomycetota bacterium]
MPTQDQAPERRPRQSALDRARLDLAAGRPDLARDRLTGYLYTLHRRGDFSQDAYLLLGEAHFAMRDYARAGAAWLLTERSGEDTERAVAEFHKRFGRDPANVLQQVKPRAPSEDYPPAVQERLKGWGYRYRPYRPRSNPHAMHELTGEEKQQGLRGIEIGCGLALLAGTVMFVFWIYVNFFARR